MLTESKPPNQQTPTPFSVHEMGRLFLCSAAFIFVSAPQSLLSPLTLLDLGLTAGTLQDKLRRLRISTADCCWGSSSLALRDACALTSTLSCRR